MVRRYIMRFAVMAFAFGFYTAQAQYVNIPDGNLVNMLNNQFPGCMTGSMLDTTCASVVNATVVDLHGNYIADFTGIQYFDNADTLIVEFNIATSLPPLPPHLVFLNASANQLTSLPALPPTLQQLHVNNNNLTSLPALPSPLIVLDCFANALTSLPALPAGLKGITCSVNELTSLPALPAGLTYLYADVNQLSSLPPLPDSLYVLGIGNNLFTSLPALPATLSILQAGYNQLQAVPTLPSVMYQVDLQNNVDLACLPPIAEVSYDLNIDNTSITCLPNVIQHPGVWAIDSMPLCGPGGTGCAVAWNVLGYAYEDANGNCMRDSLETPLANVKVTLHQGAALLGETYSNANGLFSFNTDPTGTYTVSIDTAGLPFNVACPSGNAYSVNLTPADSFDADADFGFVCQPGYDVGVTTVFRDSGLFFPAQTAILGAYIGNLATLYGPTCDLAGLMGTVTMVFEGPVSYQGTPAGALPPSTVSGDSLIWNIADFSTIDVYHDFRVLVATDTSLSTNQFCVDINVATAPPGDNNMWNNALQHCFAIVNSFDPNFKESSPLAVTAPDEWITYTVHFQNTGTAPAINIVLRDTLDANLDASTFTYLAASHGVVANLLEGNVARFEFENIYLADSTTDEPASHGWVQYRVKTKPTLANHTTVYNTASIYFDFNAPVMTNTTENLYELTGTEAVSANDVTLKLYPNPASETIAVVHQGDLHNAAIVVCDVTGRVMLRESVNNAAPVDLSLLDFAPGVYTVQLLENNARVDQQKFVVIK